MSAVVLMLGFSFHVLSQKMNGRKSVLVIEAIATAVTAIAVAAYAFAVLNNVAYLAHHWIWGSR
ncbi:MAG: hypothetical protein N3G79_06900 [Sulfolobales archaeon]|nr:hypothetical protein [Sulfolobales archaeon]